MKYLFISLLSLALLASCTTNKYQDPELSAEERAADLVSRLTLEEKITLMIDASEEIPRLGIKRFQWWNEALHGVARAGLATVLPQPIGMAATFDPDLLRTAYLAVSDEARAKHNGFIAQGSRERYQGLTFWTPTVNLLRDPRWGRGIETYGEDPYLTGVMGLAVVDGLQDNAADTKYKKLLACAKHFAVHSGPEWNRHSYNAENIDTRQLYETYLAPFEVLVKEGKVGQVMCAYNRFEGDPCCGSNTLLTRILRDEWGYDGIVLSDCGAINDFFKEGAHQTHADAAEASAAAVLAGTDLECGSSYKKLMEAVQRGLISEADIDVSVTRLLKARFELGEMDEPEGASWSEIPADVIASAAHDTLATQLARESMTLLVNKKDILPLKRNSGLTVAVVGANATSEVMQWGNYNGTPRHTITLLEGIRQALGATDSLIYIPGCNVVGNTLMNSAFNECSSDGQPGFTARYWNDVERLGPPDVVNQVDQPFHFCTSGATVFAPGVELMGFSADYRSTFSPTKSGEVSMNIYYCGRVSLTVNGEEVKSGRTNHGERSLTYKTTVEAGQSYDIAINFEQYAASDATLNFDLGFEEPVSADRIVAATSGADVVVFVGGLAPWLEGEEMSVDAPGFYRGDRTEIELPDVQREVIARLHNAGRRVVFVCCSGSAIAMVPEVANCDAILQAWYPGQSGGKAVAEVLFGDYNPSGRLPFTIYKNLQQLPDFEDYNMAGRTYRYLTSEPLFAFGYGLSYTTYEYGALQLHTPEVKADSAVVSIEIPVTNTGELDGDEIVQVYLKKKGDKTGPLKTLRDFRRVPIRAGQKVNVSFNLSGRQLEWWDTETNSMHLTPGEYTLMAGCSSRDEDLQAVDFTIR